MPKASSSYLRSKARGLALQVLYESDMARHSMEASLGWLSMESRFADASLAYAQDLMQGVKDRQAELDEFIWKYAPAWPVGQLPVVERNILRLALFEICYGGGTPPKVAINEAVELAKTFGSESSPRFINGVLGSVMDEIEALSQESPVTAGENIS